MSNLLKVGFKAMCNTLASGLLSKKDQAQMKDQAYKKDRAKKQAAVAVATGRNNPLYEARLQGRAAGGLNPLYNPTHEPKASAPKLVKRSATTARKAAPAPFKRSATMERDANVDPVAIAANKLQTRKVWQSKKADSNQEITWLEMPEYSPAADFKWSEKL